MWNEDGTKESMGGERNTGLPKSAQKGEKGGQSSKAGQGSDVQVAHLRTLEKGNFKLIGGDVPERSEGKQLKIFKKIQANRVQV